jgi:hypothetical protein
MNKNYITQIVFLSLLLISGRLVANTVLVHNNTSWPIFVWPIPAKNPPFLLAKVPNKEPGMITTPAKLEWPGDANAMVVIAEKHAAVFQTIVNNTIADYNNKGKPANYPWTSNIRSSLFNANLPSSEQAIFYPRGSGMGNEVLLEKFKDYRLVVYNAYTGGRGIGNLMGVAEPLDWNSGLEKHFGIQ